MKKLLLTIALFFIVSPVWAATYYVRMDGGSWGSSATTCNGLTDAAFTGANGPNCAVLNPMELFPPNSSSRISGGDTVIIYEYDPNNPSNQAQYEIGYDTAPHTGNCNFSNQRQGCKMAAVPEGTVGNRTKIYGRNYASCNDTNPEDKAQLWGGDGVVDSIFRPGSHVEFKCLELTDHTQQNAHGISGETLCDRDCTNGACECGAIYGLEAAGQTDIYLENVDIHGVASAGLFLAKMGDVTLYRTKIVGSPLDGWLADNVNLTNAGISQDFTGTVSILSSEIMWSGCEEVYPLTTQTIESSTDKRNCKNSAHSTGAALTNGDAIDMAEVNDIGNWIIEDSDISFNYADGPDLLHGQWNNRTMVVRRSRFEGNTGNAIKTTAETQIENSKIIGNCAFGYNQSFTASKKTDGTSLNPWDFQYCRGNGVPVVLIIGGGRNHNIFNSTILSNGDTVIYSQGSGCTDDSITMRNSIVLGGVDAYNDTSIPGNGSGNELTGLYFAGGPDGSGSGSCGLVPLTYSNNVVWNTKDGGVSGNNKYQNPSFNGTIPMGPGTYYTGSEADVTLSSASPALSYADETVNVSETVDYNNWPRGASWDSGAYEFDTQGGQTAPCDLNCEDCSLGQCLSSALTCYVWDSAAPFCRATQETCADDINDCTILDCESNGYFWYNNTCNMSPQGCSTSCRNCNDQTTCEGSPQRCSWINSGCKDYSVINATGSDPTATISGEDYSIVINGGSSWDSLYFPNSDGSSTDSLLGSAYFVRMLGGGGPYTTPRSSITALDVDNNVFVQYSQSGNLQTSGLITYGQFNYWATFFRDRVVLRVEARETTDAGNNSLRVSWDEDLRASAGGVTLLDGNQYRWKENGTAGTWATENVDGAEPSGADFILPVAKQMRMDVGSTDGVWVQIATDLSNTNFTTVTLEENNDWDDMTLFVNPTLNQWVDATTVHLFYTSNLFQDADVDEHIKDLESPATLSNFDSGSLKTDATGDDDADGFNERYGWYELTGDSGGVVQFDIPDVDIVRKTPVFKLNNAILDTYIISINGVIMVEGDDYLITTEADEAEVGTNVRVVQFLNDIVTGAVDVSMAGSAECSISACGFCTTTADCTNAGCFNQLDGTCASTEDPCHLSCGSCADSSDCSASNLGCFYYNATCNSEAQPVPERNAVMGGGCSIRGRGEIR